MPLRCRPTFLVPAVLVLLVAGACGSDPEVADPSPPFTTPTSLGTVPTGDTTVESGTEVLRFDAPTEVACTSTATVEVSYATRGVTTIGFAVDGASVTGPPAPTSGTYDLSLPCDGRVHTIMLAGSGPGADSPVFATKAIATRPS